MWDDIPADLPEAPLERALALQNLLIAKATGGEGDGDAYTILRREFIADVTTKRLLPSYVRSCRDLSAFWAVAKSMSGQWEPRRVQIRADFEPLLDFLESVGRSPLDIEAGIALSTLRGEGVSVVWERALERRSNDPEGAITAARTLIETVCKHILDEAGEQYDEGVELPALYKQVAKTLNLAPSAHTEGVFKQILGGCVSVVGGLGAVRNRIGDAHGHGVKGARPLPRHAQLAVNLAGAMATFLVETWRAKLDQAA